MQAVFNLRDANNDHLDSFQHLTPAIFFKLNMRVSWILLLPNSLFGHGGLEYGSCMPGHGCFNTSSVPHLEYTGSNTRDRLFKWTQVQFGYTCSHSSNELVSAANHAWIQTRMKCNVRSKITKTERWCNIYSFIVTSRKKCWVLYEMKFVFLLTGPLRRSHT